MKGLLRFEGWNHRRGTKRGGGGLGGFAIAIGMFLASILDPKTKIMTEMIDTRKNRDTTDPGLENA